MTSHSRFIRFGALVVLVAVSACSRSVSDGRPTTALLPNAPTSLSAGVSSFVDPAAGRYGTLAISLPSPEDALAFRQVLEAKLRALGRPVQTTYVNAEGVIVWMLEYLRYRANGCSQSDAVDRVFAQIDRRGIPPTCSESASGTPAFPPQSESLAFRQLLEVKYRDDLKAPLTQTFVDVLSEVVYTLEFVRYSQSGCSSASSYERVFVQIDGRGVEPDCRSNPPPSCTFGISPTTQSLPPTGGRLTVSVFAEPSQCSWQLTSDVAWITGTPSSGAGSAAVAYVVADNPGTQARTGRITLVGSDGSQALLQINQGGQTSPLPPPPTPCSYAVSPTTVNAIPDGGTYDVQVATGPGCAWSASSSASFVSIASGSSGVGSGTAQFTVAGNARDARQGTGQISWSTGSQSILFSQGEAPLQAIIGAPASCEVAINCPFDGTQSKGVITDYLWDFGDNSVGSGALVVHVYPFAYVANDSDQSIDTTVTLTVRGPSGSSTTTILVRVYYVRPP